MMGKQNEYADAFKKAFDEKFEYEYLWKNGDFVHLAKFREQRMVVTPERFVEVAKFHWDAKFTLPSSLTIRGLTTNWAALASSLPALKEYRKADYVSEAT